MTVSPHVDVDLGEGSAVAECFRSRRLGQAVDLDSALVVERKENQQRQQGGLAHYYAFVLLMHRCLEGTLE